MFFGLLLRGPSLEVHATYVREIEEMAADPTVAHKVEGIKFCAEEGQWLTEVCTGFAICFVCRLPECLYYGGNDQWRACNDRIFYIQSDASTAGCLL